MQPMQNDPPRADARFFDHQGKSAQGWEAIVPICKMFEDGDIAYIGTGFFISLDVLVTAAHVITDQEKKQPEGLFILQYVHPNKMFRRPINKATVHTRHDVAVCTVVSGNDPATGARLRNKNLIVMTAQPNCSEDIGTWAFPNVTKRIVENKGELIVQPKVYVGRIVGEHPEGRDRVMLPGRCYETDLAIEGGTSGGPVFDCSGRVFAVNSTGIDGTNIGYVSHIQSIGGLPIALFKTPDGVVHDNITIDELIRLGLIGTHIPATP